MATFKEIRGQLIKKYTTNPTDPLEGQMWYNNTTGTLKGVVISEAWSSASPMVTARSTVGASTSGTQNASAVFGGYLGPPGVTNLTEEYNGSGWSVGGNLGTARYYIGGSGTLTAGLGFTGGAGTPGGSNATGATEEYDGSTWTAGGTMSTARVYVGTGTGTQTASFCFGGSTVPYPPSSPTNLVEEYNGASWTSSPAMPRSSRMSLGFGTTTAAVNCGGNDFTTTTDEWNGTSWTEGGTMLAATDAGASMGIQTAGIIAGGGNPSTAILNTSSKYDGTTWTALPTLGAPVRHFSGAGTSTAAIVSGGYPGSGVTDLAEEFNVSTNVITAGAWASGNNMNTAQQNPGGFGTQTAGVSVGGEEPPNSNKTENYDGSSWAVSGVYPVALTGIGTAGTQTAGLGFGGRDPAGVTTAAEYDGSSWTAATAYPTAIALACGVGPQTAALAATGDVYPASPRYSDLCNDYNGSSWTAAAANTGSARYDAMAAGTATAAAICGGTNPGSGATEEFNGASWTTGGANLLNISAGGSSKNGTSDDWMVFSLNAVTTTGYDGTAWSTRPSLATSRYGAGGCGTGSAGLCFGGRAPGFSTATEEFTAETSATNIKTVTTS